MSSGLNTLYDMVKKSGFSLRNLAQKLEVSTGSLHSFLHGNLPKRNFDKIISGLKEILQNEEANNILDNLKINPEGEEMILRKQNLHQETREFFGLVVNPLGDPKSQKDLYFNKRSRFVRECMLDAAINGNFLAVVGESGAGKSTLRMDLVENLKQSDRPVILIEPYTLTMSQNKAGGTLKSRHIMEAILSALLPSSSMPLSPQILAQRVHSALLESHKSGFRHCLIIEEAHDIHLTTMKSLKRFWELMDGMSRLISIIIIGQPELKRILGTSSSEIREVVQRCDVVELQAIEDLEEYLSFRFEKSGYKLTDFFEDKAIKAMAEKLVVAKSKDSHKNYCYPLAIGNLATAGLNLAANLGEEKVTAEIIGSVQR